MHIFEMRSRLQASKVRGDVGFGKPVKARHGARHGKR